jgi:hypothetical protein
MPTKKDLAAPLSETPQPLRRGRGLRLSSASKQAHGLASKPSSAPEPSGAVALPSVALAAEAAAPAAPTIAPAAEAAPEVIAPIELAASSDSAPLKPEREKRKLLLRKDLLKQCKRIARAQDRKLAQVVESALEEYIQRYGAHE